MSFERFNKKIKNMVGNASHPIASLKSALIRDAASSCKKWRDAKVQEMVDSRCKPLELSAGRLYPLPVALAVKLQLRGAICQCCSFIDLKLCTQHKRAKINAVQVIYL